MGRVVPWDLCRTLCNIGPDSVPVETLHYTQDTGIGKPLSFIYVINRLDLVGIRTWLLVNV